MFKRIAVLSIFLLAIFFSFAYADMTDQATIGGQDSNGNYYWRVDTNGTLVPSSLASTKSVVETFTTGDTLTTTETGKICVSYLDNPAGIVDFVLPAVASGLKYKFIAGHTSYIRIDPAGTNRIMYSTCTAGDRVLSAGASADSIELVSDGTYWYVGEMKGTWTDAN